MGSRMVDQDPAHHLRGDAKEMRAILPVHLALIDELEEGFVDQGRGLKGVVAPLPAQVGGGEPPQLGINRRQEPVERILPPETPLLEQLRDLSAWRLHVGITGRIRFRPPDTNWIPESLLP